jgi:hypothetical protein
MSKLDAQRAMREAKYARDRASGPTRREAAAGESGVPAQAAARPNSRPATKAQRTSTAPATPAAPAADPKAERCGHRSMNGRSCTRDAGHYETSHRYS